MGWPQPGTLPIGVDASWPRTLYPFAAPEAVSTERPLLALVSLGVHYADLVFVVRNHDLTNKVMFYVDHSQSGVATNATRDITEVLPGHEQELPLRDVLSLFWGLSAAGDPDAGFPSCNVSWTLVGRRRDYT